MSFAALGAPVCGRNPRLRLTAVLVVAGVLNSPMARAAGKIADLSLEALMQIEITSVTREAQSLSDAPAAVYVITREDIRRSGLTSIPELLRLVPGLSVAQANGNQWAITARGFNGVFSQKLLVLIDGRSVYTPLFSGVHWDVQGTFLDDVERIEVIRGPGGSLWGANAVNGVVNVITREARESQGAIVKGQFDTRDSALGAARIGGTLGVSGHYRAYLQAEERSELEREDGSTPQDGFRETRAGFRADWSLLAADAITVQGDAYYADAQTRTFVTSLDPAGVSTILESDVLSGANLIATWRRDRDDGSGFVLSSYLDRAERRNSTLASRIDTLDVEYRHQFRSGSLHDVSWGVGYRQVSDRLQNSFTVSATPEARTTHLYTTYVHDVISLADSISLTLGSKFEYNDYTRFEFQPNLRVLWEINASDRLWGAVSRAVRTPSRAEMDIRFNAAAVPGATFPTLIALMGRGDFDSEELLAWEIGYRSRISEDATVDIAAFYNQYDNLLTLETMTPVLELSASPPHLVVPSVFDNLGNAETYGIELTWNWQPMPQWHLRAAYSWFDSDFGAAPFSTYAGRAIQSEGTSPRHQAQLHSRLDLGSGVDVDVAWYWVDEIPALGVAAYSRIDVRLGWRLAANFDLSLTGQNLADASHAEFLASELETVATSVPRSVMLAARWRF